MLHTCRNVHAWFDGYPSCRPAAPALPLTLCASLLAPPAGNAILRVAAMYVYLSSVEETSITHTLGTPLLFLASEPPSCGASACCDNMHVIRLKGSAVHSKVHVELPVAMNDRRRAQLQ